MIFNRSGVRFVNSLRYGRIIRKNRNSANYARLKAALEPMKEKYNVWSKTYDDEDAKRMLTDFFEEFKSIPADTVLDLGHGGSYYSFYWGVFITGKAMRAGRYGEACHELLSLASKEKLLLQRRVHAALMKLYHDYLE